MEKSDNNKELRVLTIDELRAYEGLNDLSDEQAKEMITIFKNLSLLAHKIIIKNERITRI